MNRRERISRLKGPLMRTTATAPAPGTVAMAAMVSGEVFSPARPGAEKDECCKVCAMLKP